MLSYVLAGISSGLVLKSLADSVDSTFIVMGIIGAIGLSSLALSGALVAEALGTSAGEREKGVFIAF